MVPDNDRTPDIETDANAPATGAADGEPLRSGNIKVTRQDWLDAALAILISDGIERVRVLTLSDRLGVSRSSFYWYFKSRRELLDALLEVWERRNTKIIVAAAAEPAETITEAVCNLFKCFIDDDVFSPQLDFAVREWSRRSESVHDIVRRSDLKRIEAIRTLFERFGYNSADADSRARILYYMQIGYYALELQESRETRIAATAGWLRGFTGKEPRQSEIDGFAAYVREREAQRADRTGAQADETSSELSKPKEVEP